MHLISQRFFTWLLIVIIALSVSACAFKLRNANELPPALHKIYLATDEPYGRFETTLRAILHSSDVSLVDMPTAAPIVLHITKPNLVYTATTIGTSNQSRVYSVVYGIIFSLLDAKGDLLLGPETITSVRSLTLSANQLIESNNQLSLLEQDMQRDVISQLYNRLGSQQVAQLLQTKLSSP